MRERQTATHAAPAHRSHSSTAKGSGAHLVLTRVGEFPPFFFFFLQWIPAGYEAGCFWSCYGRTGLWHRSFPHSSCKYIVSIIQFRAVNVVVCRLLVSSARITFNEPLTVCRLYSTCALGGVRVVVVVGGRSFHSCTGGHLEGDTFEGGQYFSFPLAARQQFVAGRWLCPRSAVTAPLWSCRGVTVASPGPVPLCKMTKVGPCLWLFRVWSLFIPLQW